MLKFTERFQVLRKESNKTQAAIAEELGMTPQTLSYYANGREPNYDTLSKIADYFGVSTDYLLGRSEFKSCKQEYDFEKRLPPESFDNLAAQYKIYNSDPHVRELNALTVLIDEKYSSIILQILAKNNKFSTFALTALNHLFNMIDYAGVILEGDEYDSDMHQYIEFLKKLINADLSTSDFGHIQADHQLIKACTRYFNEFITFYIYSIIKFKTQKPTTEV
jgi:transcriptional regulator with XRE-family HTH domain